MVSLRLTPHLIGSLGILEMVHFFGNFGNGATRAWTDRNSTAADSSLRCSYGIWVSPYFLPLLFIGMIFFLAVGVQSKSPSLLVAAFIFGTSTVLLWKGFRKETRYLWGLWAGLNTLFYTHMIVMHLRDDEDLFLKSGSQNCNLWLPHTPLSLIWVWGLVLFPQYSFIFLLPFHLVLHASGGALILACDKAPIGNLYYDSWATAACFGCWILLTLRYRDALSLAKTLVDADEKKHNELWDELMTDSHFVAGLDDLKATWILVMSKAFRTPKLQLVPSIGELFLRADLLNDVFQVKLQELCAGLGGVLHFAPVKSEQRAMEKVYRSYSGNWRKLCDVVRTSVIFQDPYTLAVGLQAIAADPELTLLRQPDDKMRLCKSYDAKATGGYRDVQICVMFNNEETRKRSVESIVCEVQFHLAAFCVLKLDGGHQTYVTSRNFRGK